MATVLDSGCLIEGKPGKDGYVRIKREGKVWLIHRWIMHLAYGPDPRPVLHACDNKACSNLFHLRYDTLSANSRDHRVRGARSTKLKLLPEQVQAIRNAVLLSRKELALTYGVSVSCIKKIRSGENWSYV